MVDMVLRIRIIEFGRKTKETTMPPKKNPSKRSAGKANPQTPEPEPVNMPAGSTALGETSAPSGASVSDDEIARRAYALWENRGRPIGSPEEDWYRAMQELRASGSYGPQK
jgi:hypothetical protein